jgi:hypothetical protein
MHHWLESIPSLSKSRSGSFQNRAGLYFAAFDAEDIDMQERVQYTSWIKDVPPKSSYVGAGALVRLGIVWLRKSATE